MARWSLLVLVLALTGTTLMGTVTAQEKRVKIDIPTSELLLGPDVVRDGATVRLARSLLLSHGLGATDYKQSEKLSDKVWARTVFDLESADVADAELFYYGSAKEVVVNQKELGPGEKLKSTGWSRIKVPTSVLKKGNNDIVFRGGGSLIVEPARPGKSFKSTDGGATWSGDNMTGTRDVTGDYIVRLRLERFTPRGWVLTPTIDLWQAGLGLGIVPAPIEIARVSAELSKPPAGTTLKFLARSGTTPTPDDKDWTGWIDLARLVPGKQRWLQVKVELATSDAQKSPHLSTLALNLDTIGAVPSMPLRIESTRKEPLRQTFLPFAYQGKSPRLELLRTRYKLDDVVAPGKTELEKLMLLRYWVRNQWHTAWSGGPASWMPPWDALIILESKDHPDCLTMCTHYAAVYTQCCQALGWTARHCILDHHCVSEVYMMDLGKWAMMDAGNSGRRADVGLHYERKGIPLSAREIHLAFKSGQTADLMVHFTSPQLAERIASQCRPWPKAKTEPVPEFLPAAELTKYPVCQIENYRRYGFPARNNFLASLVPGELYQGMSAYFYDGYWWVGDSPDQPTQSPEYSLHLDPNRPQDVDWHVNWTRIHLAQSKPGTTQVQLETLTPGFTHFEKRDATKDTWTRVPASFSWQLTPGRNELTVRSVNHWGKTGTPETVRVEWKGE